MGAPVLPGGFCPPDDPDGQKSSDAQLPLRLSNHLADTGHTLGGLPSGWFEEHVVTTVR